MGCGIHSVLQKENHRGEFETVITGFINVGSSACREFITDAYTNISGMANPIDKNFPDGFSHHEEDGAVIHGNYYLGEHSFMNFHADDFIRYFKDQVNGAPKSYTIHNDGNSITIDFDDLNQDHVLMREMINLLEHLTGYEPEKYRVILGFDS